MNVLFDEAEQQSSDESERADEFPRRDEVGRIRAGRLLAPDRGVGEDDDGELVAEDVGIDGSAATAEEAAMHLIDDAEDSTWR